MNDPRVQAIFKRSRHKSLSILIISQDYYEIPKQTNRADGNIYHIFTSKNFRDIQKFYQDKASKDMSPDEVKIITNNCWDKKINL